MRESWVIVLLMIMLLNWFRQLDFDRLPELKERIKNGEKLVNLPLAIWGLFECFGMLFQVFFFWGLLIF